MILCDECDKPFKWYQRKLQYKDVSRLYHYRCIRFCMRPIRWLAITRWKKGIRFPEDLK